ncbi:MAG: capsule assembly Wzi family protein [Terracidiphilus sp.]|nr:capsule assembly Wzi family protein [Terracidiphilus sp.]
MNVHRHVVIAPAFLYATVLAGLILVTATLIAAQQPASPDGTGQLVRNASRPETVCESSTLGSPYIPVDSWVYPAVLRLYSMGYIDQVYLGMRPWTRASLSNLLEDIGAQIEDANTYEVSTASEAQDIYTALSHFLHYSTGMQCLTQQGGEHVESLYSVARGISGTPLRDSFHLGSTIINDYGRPYENGFNNYTGASGYATAGRFAFYLRGEFHEAPSATGYSNALAQQLASIDGTNSYYTNTTNYPIFSHTPAIPLSQLTTISLGPIATVTNGRVMEAYVSATVANHIFSFGKQDEWLGPAQGGAFAYSNNAENIYAFRINRIEPLRIPLLSLLTGPFRYEFLIGPLKGHVYPANPWVHVEKFSFKPTRDLEFGFERTVIWGGKDHEPITLHSFLKSFLDPNPTDPSEKFSVNDPGARFGTFDFTYRLPYLSNWLTLYTDMEAHDAPSPIAKPFHGTFRPGLYLSHFPGIPKLDLRVEGIDTDSSMCSYLNGAKTCTDMSIGGLYQYWEGVQRQGYTNQGQIFGDWIGREGKGGQGWITYHLSGNEWFQVGVRNQKVAKDFIPGGTTLNDINFQAIKRIGKDFEINGNFTYERWKAPIYLPGRQTVTTTTIQFTWFPQHKTQ